MTPYSVKTHPISGSNFSEVYKKAYSIYEQMKLKTKRRPYIRSAFFGKEKIFLGLYWAHVHQKLNHRDKIRRLKFFPCALELLKNNRNKPTIKINPNKSSENLIRFAGITQDKQLFIVQIKENTKSKEKYLISTFPTLGIK